MEKKIVIRRLTVLRNFMRSLPRSADKHFNMLSWFRHDGPNDHKHVEQKKPITKESLEGCGTSACAAGWAATIPAFRRAGFKYVPGEGFSIEPEEFFGLDCHHNTALFYEYKIKTPKAWAKKADEVLKELRAA